MANIYSNCPTAPGAVEIARFLSDHNYKHVFGLPGSQLVSAFYELQKTEIQYVPTVHESATIAAADGYARVAGKAAAMIYMYPGAANALANLYNAFMDDSPLLVIGSQQLSTMRTGIGGGACEGEVIPIVQPVTRLAKELTKGTPVRHWLEKAKRASEGPTGGPVYLNISEDVLTEPGPVLDERLSVRAGPGIPDVAAVLDALRKSERPLIIAGGQLRRCGGSEAIEQLAEQFEVPVAIDRGFCGALGVAPGHSHCIGSANSAMYMDQNADFVLMLGTRFITESHPASRQYFPKASFVAQVNTDPVRLEMTRTVDWVSTADPGAFAKQLLAELRAGPAPDEALLAKRRKWIGERPAPQSPSGPLGKLMSEFARGLAPLHDAMDRGWVLDESAMSGGVLVNTLKAKDGRRFANGGGASLGWAAGASAGVALASGEPVTTVLGDGAARFGAQGLWTVKALNLPVTYVVMDNNGYSSTRNFEREHIATLGPQANARPGYLNMDMRTLGPDIAELFRGFGIPTARVPVGENPRGAIEKAWAESPKGPNCVIVSMAWEDE